jgi:hypothetical protein
MIKKIKSKMKVIDWNKVEWSKIFGAISNMKELKGPQYNFMKADIAEHALEKYSNGQLKYVGNVSIGKDFVGIDGLNYEMKCKNNLIKKRSYQTSQIILKNFHTNNTGLPPKTFDKMIAVDTEQNTVLLCDWETIDMTVNDATVSCTLNEKKCDALAINVTPKIKPMQFIEEYQKFVKKII